jgi:thiosulfate dehydrogenase (quinone) large subunit
MNIKRIVWLKLRFVMGFIFLWAFADKLLGLGFSTQKSAAWINGGSPTRGYLLNATKGPFADFFQSLAGIAIVDWLFMLGLLGVGLTLVFNRYVTWGATAGSVMMILMWLATFPPTTNPIVDYHIVYVLVLTILCLKSRDR